MKILKISDLYTFSGSIIRYVNYISLKVLQKKEFSFHF